MDPTDRSIPAVAMTKVAPTPMTMIGAVCRATFRRLMEVKKFSEANAMTPTHRARPMNVP